MPNGTWTTCWKCKTEYFLPEALNTAAHASQNVSFYCPYGHSAIFSEGPTEAEKLRRERDRLKQRIAQKDDEISCERMGRQVAECQVSAQKGVVTKLKNRAKAGVCPCCHRTVKQLARHMETKHPRYSTDAPDLKIAKGGKK